jgi:hypothetical protein
MRRNRHGKQSAIGPIDPQITLPGPHGQFTAPAQSILDDFEKAKSSIVEDPRTAPLWITRINSLPPGILNICNNTIANSKAKVAEWLDRYMFRNSAEKKGSEIAEWLGNTGEHKTHGRPIGITLANSRGLTVKPLEDDQEFQDKVLSVFHACAVTLDVTPVIKFIENHIDKGWFLAVEQVQAPMVPNNPCSRRANRAQLMGDVRLTLRAGSFLLKNISIQKMKAKSSCIIQLLAYDYFIIIFLIIGGKTWYILSFG